MSRILLCTTLCLFILSGCSAAQTEPENLDLSDVDVSDASSSREPVIRETNNVSYSGVVRPLGISIYMEGSHRLSLPDGRFILLESDSHDLNGYVGETVDVVGAIRPTVESDAMIMRVDSISLMDQVEEEPEEGSSSSPRSRFEDEDGSSEKAESSAEPVSSAEQSESYMGVTAESSRPTIDLSAQIAAMADEDFSAPNWTQEYCSSHIGFCVPVHRNWWYKSFGATSTHYWHLEIAPEPLEELYRGPLVVNLDGESLSALNIEDGSVLTEGDEVVGYKSWTNGRHFEIRADASLRGAVEFMTQGLRSEG